MSCSATSRRSLSRPPHAPDSPASAWPTSPGTGSTPPGPTSGRSIDCIRRGYAQTDRLLRLPLHSTDADAFLPFRHVEDVPLVARTASQSRATVRAAHGLPLDARLVLLSFGGFNAPGLDMRAFGQWTDYLFVTTPPVSVSPVRCRRTWSVERAAGRLRVAFWPRATRSSPSRATASSADCLANRVAVLYTERGPFREYPVLADALERLGNARHIGNPALLAGDVGPHLDALLDRPRPWTALRLEGADVVANRIFALVGTPVR